MRYLAPTVCVFAALTGCGESDEPQSPPAPIQELTYRPDEVCLAEDITPPTKGVESKTANGVKLEAWQGEDGRILARVTNLREENLELSPHGPWFKVHDGELFVENGYQRASYATKQVCFSTDYWVGVPPPHSLPSGASCTMEKRLDHPIEDHVGDFGAGGNPDPWGRYEPEWFPEVRVGVLFAPGRLRGLHVTLPLAQPLQVWAYHRSPDKIDQPYYDERPRWRHFEAPEMAETRQRYEAAALR